MARKKYSSEVNSIINQYATEVEKIFPIEHIFVFGSAARGTMTKDSDIDLIIISKRFEKVNFMRRLELLSRASFVCANRAALDVVGYTPKEFLEMDAVDSPMIKKIKREGYFVR